MCSGHGRVIVVSKLVYMGMGEGKQPNDGYECCGRKGGSGEKRGGGAMEVLRVVSLQA